MLTRLRVSGFKNLVDVDVRFGPFTCIAGANGVGKSNLFDAIGFLSAMANHPLSEAAMSVRNPEGRTGDIRSLFHRVGERYDDRMDFEVEMIVPKEGFDDLGQKAVASQTFLRYTVSLGYRGDDNSSSAGRLVILREDLAYVKRGDARDHLAFMGKSDAWLHSAVQGARRAPFISTETQEEGCVIKVHQDGGSSGKPRTLLAANLPRTALSAANAAESPTATMARREMESWRLLQLEPSKLRSPDPFTAPKRLAEDGSHLPATLYRLARAATRENRNRDADAASQRVYSQLANRLSELIDDVKEVFVDRDERRELFTIMVQDAVGTTHPARSLSDGTLRFLALAVLALDPDEKCLICLEEPENGIHPARISAMLELLQDIVTDVERPVDEDNPLRQVIVNTHSQAVISQVPDDSLLMAELREHVLQGERFKALACSPVRDTWRSKVDDGKVRAADPGAFGPYLNPAPQRQPGRPRTLVDRPDMQGYLPFSESA